MNLSPKRLSIPDDTAHKFSYLLKDLEIVRLNQVWSTGITYIIIKKGHMYLTAIIDVYSRKILSWELSNSLSKEFCITCFNKAVLKYRWKGSLNLYKGIRWFICYYNGERYHSSLGRKTPNEVYETSNLTFKKIA